MAEKDSFDVRSTPIDRSGEKEERTKRAKAARRKGKRGERALCQRLEQTFGVAFHRTPASGAMRWGKRADVRGDIICEELWFPFVVEEKNREAWDLELFFKGKGGIWKWWGQVLGDSKDVGKIPLLFIDKVRSPGFVIFRIRDVAELFNDKPRTYMRVWHEELGILRLVEREEFLNCLSVEKCKNAIADNSR